MAKLAQEKKGKCPTFLNRKRPFLSSLLDTTVLVEFCQTSTLIDGLLLCTTEAWKSIYLPVFAFDIQISRLLICLVLERYWLVGPISCKILPGISYEYCLIFVTQRLN